MLSKHFGRGCCQVFQKRVVYRTIAYENFTKINLNELQPDRKSKIRDRKYLASSYSPNMPQFLNYEHHPMMDCVQYIGEPSLEHFAKVFRNYIDANLADYSAILCKNTLVRDDKDFSMVMKLTELPQMEYISGNASRGRIVDDIYEASNEPPELSIDAHNEMAYLTTFPSKIMFCCIIPPLQEGETVVVFNKELQSKLDQKFLERVDQRKIRYIRYYNNEEHVNYMTWQAIFNTTSRKKVESILSANDNEWEWYKDGTLSSWYIAEPFINHPRTSERIWFNQLHAAHNTFYLEHPDFFENPDADLTRIPLHTCYGDGEEFKMEEINHIREVQWKIARGFKWEKGDILVLDNLLAQHGRVSFQGKRKLAVSLIQDN